MLFIKIENSEMADKIHKALRGSKCYIESEVALVKIQDDGSHCLVIGEPSCDNIVVKIVE